nr:NB-ARC domain-containing protein [uncultured Actinoplanes sp.]
MARLGDGDDAPHVTRPLLRPWTAPPPIPGLVARPALSDRLLDLVTGDTPGPAGLCGLYGTGGFGKTTLATWVSRQPATRERFPGGLLWVTLGEHVTAPELAGRVNDLVEHLTGTRPAVTEASQAGARLGALLDSTTEPVLLIVDDVRTAAQLAPFVTGGARCRRLVTTRHRGLLPAETSVEVDRMSPAEATALLLRDLPARVTPGVVAKILAGTGRWPLLLGLANRAARRAVRYGTAPEAALREIATRLPREGPITVDRDAGRDRAVDATVRTGLNLLPESYADRFAELAVFGEGVEIPLEVLRLLWAKRPGEVARICEALADLSLILAYRGTPGTVRLHDVIRAYLVHTTDAGHRVALHNRLLDAAKPGTWWTLTNEYLIAHLAEHLDAAGRTEELEETVTDLRWTLLRLQKHGPASVEADLAHATSGTATTLARVIRQDGHLLGPTDPRPALGAILASRLDHVPELRSRLAVLTAGLPTPRLAPRRPPAGTPHPSLLRTIEDPGVTAPVVIAPNGEWFTTGNARGLVPIRQAADGSVRHVLGAGQGPVSAVAIAPDSSWLVTADARGTVRTWDAADGRERHVLTAHTGAVSSVAIAPDGTWFVTVGADRRGRIWDARTGELLQVLAGQAGLDRTGLDLTGTRPGNPAATAVAPDGSWLASVEAGTIRVWSAPPGRTLLPRRDDGDGAGPGAPPTSQGTVAGGIAATRDGSLLLTWGSAGAHVREMPRLRTVTTLDCTIGRSEPVVLADDGSWLAHVLGSHAVEIWDIRRNRFTARHEIPGPRPAGDGAGPRYGAMVLTPDGRSLVVCGANGHVWVIAVHGGDCTRRFRAHRGSIGAAVVAPDGTWLMTAGTDGTAKVWDWDTGACVRTLTGVSTVPAAAVSPDGSWLGIGTSDGEVQIWDPASGRLLHRLGRHGGEITTVAASSAGDWLVIGTRAGTLRICNARNGHLATMMRVDSPIEDCCWYGGDRGLLVSGPGGHHVFSFVR